ncbi:MAG TPA: o-succinylbenzoate synthase [Acidimicrobiales bacterium]|nr:o-succinylbenzoate synthase [Acidimicrobiales bacterium]
MSGSRLAGLELVRVSLPLAEPWDSGAGSFAVRDSLLVRAVVHGLGSDGRAAVAEGWGECPALPAPTYNSEYTAGAVAVSSTFLVPALLRAQPASWAQAASAMAAVRGHSMAKTAFEMALVDAWLRLEGDGVPMARYLARQASTEPRRTVPAGVAVGLCRDLGKLLAQVGDYVDAGYGRVKLKIEPGHDVAPLRAVRERWPHLVLFADANGAYAAGGVEGAFEQLCGLQELDLACLEQPLADDDLVGHSALARKLAVPVCLDEALSSVGALDAALQMGACSVVNIKAGRFGGYHEALRAYRACRAKGARIWCGGMVETGIGRAANLALAALSGFDLAGDISASGRFFAEDIAGPFPLLPGGTIAVPDGPGLGAQIYTEVIDRHCAWRKWWAT